MPAFTIPLCIKLELVGQCFGQDVINVLHYKYSGSAPNSSTLLTFINAWKTAHMSQFLALHSNEYTLREIKATDIATGSGAFAVDTPVGANIGTQGSGALPNNVALAISWRTSLVGRRNRGRSFIGGIGANSVDNDAITSSMSSSLVTFALALISQTFAGGQDFGVASKADNAVKIVTGLVIEATLDSMRRRLTERGS